VSSLLVEAALELSRVTGRVALAHYREHQRARSLAVETKADGSPVSVADRAAEEAARAFLARRFPDDGVLGEELGETRPEARRKWCIDPIDGTKSFLRGVPLWGSLVALVEGDTVLAGAAYFPVTDEAIAAGPGEGCFAEGVRAGVSDVATLAEATVLTTDERFPDIPACEAPWRALAARAKIARSWGDCYGYYLVATGRAELMTDGRLSPWDAACFQPIVEEAGGVFTDWRGLRTSFGEGVIATNRGVAAEARALLVR
jgi:histidinol phosphatase-like enzyme (inositol monophosphatase family)